jgi:hypothetical protein
VSLQQRKRLGELGERIKASAQLSEADQAYLVDLFECIAHGEDANKMLQLTYGRGEKRLNQQVNANYARLFHWIMGAMEPEPDGYGLGVGQAIEAASGFSRNEPWRNPKTGEVFEPPEVNFLRYVSSEALHEAWYDNKNDDLKALHVNPSTYDFRAEGRKGEDETTGSNQ